MDTTFQRLLNKNKQIGGKKSIKDFDFFDSSKYLVFTRLESRNSANDDDDDYVMEVDQDDSDDSTDEVESSTITYPCCICETIVCTPKELGTNILEEHCDQTEST